MKLFALLLYPLLIYSQADTLQWEIDLNNDSQSEHISFVFNDSTYKLKINSLSLDLESNALISIVDEKGLDNIIVFDDINNDGTKEIIINVEDPLFYNKSYLRILSYTGNEINSVPVITESNKKFSQIFSLDKTGVYNFETKSLYIKTANQSFDTSAGETLFYSEISLFRWDPKVGFIIKLGEKYFRGINKRELWKVIF